MGKQRGEHTHSGMGTGQSAVEEEEEIYCGVGRFRPAVIQGCASMGCLTVALSLAGLCTSTLNIYINSQITTLERQFGFSSSVSGALLSCNDLGYLLTTLLASYLARRVHIPRALSLSTLLFGLSGLLCTVPYFATRADMPPASLLTATQSRGLNFSAVSLVSPGVFSPRELPRAMFCEMPNVTSGSASEALTSAGRNFTAAVDACEEEGGKTGSGAMSEGRKNLAVTIIGLGMILQGLGKSTRQPFVGIYVDDNVPKTKTTLYLGIISCISMFGPVLAFTLGGVFSRIYLTLEETTMTPMDPRWVGAWWLGFLLFGFLGILTAVPTLFFPRRLRPQPELRMLDRNRKQSAKGRMCLYNVKDFVKTVVRLLGTPVYLCMVLATSVSMFGVAGWVSFLSKYMESQFLLPTWKANILFGVLNVIAAAGGTLTGGIVTSRFKLRPITCLKLMVASSAVSSCVAVMPFFLGCDQPVISMGASVAYRHKFLHIQNNMTLTVTCNASCLCDDTRFFPICGQDGVTYFSPCHAGCSKPVGIGFGSCSCLTSDNNTMTSSSASASGVETATTSAPNDLADGTAEEELVIARPQAEPGFCDSECRSLYPYIIMNFFGAFIATSTIFPGFVVSIRSVKEVDKPLAIGLSAFMSSLLGWFLGPIVFGRVIDTCCLLWSSGCRGSGSCTLYDTALFRNRYHLLFVGTRVGCCVVYVIALLIALFKRVSFTPQDGSDVIKPTTGAEGEIPMLERNVVKTRTEDEASEEKML